MVLSRGVSTTSPSSGSQVESFGVGRSVKLPGPTKEQPNSYPFGTPYQAIYDDLAGKDSDLYTRTGLLDMARRNLNIKHAPERWQNCMCAIQCPEVCKNLA